MRRFLTITLLFVFFSLQANAGLQLKAESAYTKTYTIDNNPPNGTVWGNFQKCGDFLSQSTVTEITTYEINSRDFEKVKISCRSVTGTLDEDSSYIFNTSGAGREDSTWIKSTNGDYDYNKPVGVHILTESNKLDHIGIVSMDYNRILDKDNETISGNINISELADRRLYVGNYDYSNDSKLYSSYTPYLVATENTSGKYLACNRGDVMTGLNLQYNLEGNNERAEIRAVKIQCRTPEDI